MEENGHPFSITKVNLLTLTLRYLVSNNRQWASSPMFGLAPFSMQIWITFALKMLRKMFQRNTKGVYRVKCPSLEKLDASSKLLAEDSPDVRLMKGILGTVDDGTMPCADYTDSDIQSAYYKGYRCEAEVASLFVFKFYGKFLHAAINYLASRYGSNICILSGLMRPKLGGKTTQPGYVIIGDILFASCLDASELKLVRARKRSESRDIP